MKDNNLLTFNDSNTTRLLIEKLTDNEMIWITEGNDSVRIYMLAMELKSLETADYIYNRLINNGFLIGFKEKTIRFMPSLTIEKKDIDKLISAINNIMNNMT